MVAVGGVCPRDASADDDLDVFTETENETIRSILDFVETDRSEEMLR